MNKSIYSLVFSTTALDDLEYFKKSGNKKVLLKIARILEELTLHPDKGTGKPERLKFELSGYWSRRINKEHRLIYRFDDRKVYIVSLKGHY